MSDPQKPLSLSWDAFKMLGNPENAPVDEDEIKNEHKALAKMQIRVHYERKGRGGKETCIIRGHEGSEKEMEELCKLLKTKIGVGGAVKEREIILQGNHREKVMKILMDSGYKNAKKAGG